jgi:hypothetical protein
MYLAERGFAATAWIYLRTVVVPVEIEFVNVHVQFGRIASAGRAGYMKWDLQ